MAYIQVSAFKKLRAFFWGLQNSSFNLNRIPAKDNEGTPIDKADCLNLLRSFPDFQGEQFKDDNTIVKYLSKPGNINQILDQFTPEQQIELTKVFEERPIVAEAVSEQPAAGQEAPLPAGESTSMAGGVPFPGIAAGAATTTAPRRVIRIVPGEKPTAETPLEKRVPGLKNTPETGLDYEGKPYESDAFYMADKEKEAAAKASRTTKETPPPKTGRRFQMPKIPEGIKSFGRSIASKAGIFLKTNMLSIARTGLGAFAGGVLTGGNPLAMLGGGIGGATFNAWGRKALNGTINAGVGISNQVSRGSLVKLQGRKAAIGLILLLVIPVLLATAFTGIPGGTSTTGGGTTTGGGGLDYTIPFKDPSVRPLDIRDQVRARWSNAQLQNWDTIVQQSIAAGWNPAFVLALWIEETGAQGVPNYSDPLGCAPGQPTTDVNLSLRCLFNNFGTYTNSQFADFMCRYSEGLGKVAPCQFRTNPNFPGNLRTEYSRLVPSGPGAIVVLPTPLPSSTYTPGGGSGIISCPVNGGRRTTGSISTPGGHCSQSYLAQGLSCVAPGQPNYTGRDTAVDVQGSDRNVFLPNLGGSSVNWTIDETGTEISDNDGGGVAVGANANYNGHNYRIRFVHLESTSLRRGQTPPPPSSTLVGQHLIPTEQNRRLANHVHITIQEDGVYKPADLYFNLCR